MHLSVPLRQATEVARGAGEVRASNALQAFEAVRFGIGELEAEADPVGQDFFAGSFQD